MKTHWILNLVEHMYKWMEPSQNLCWVLPVRLELKSLKFQGLTFKPVVRKSTFQGASKW